ncbi:MAG TPA: 2-oxoacid:acceptor oxidoreductase subunit alpha [Terriglobia bacterium]|nr:2-oxoacid:acceptor oxidoreductase subunit alpha [Terriglobia bacterium]
MVPSDLALKESQAPSLRNSIINDFNILVATINGSGSQTANTVLMRAIFQMGVPVSGKNLFPSNIMGQPTWFSVRASKDGYVSRAEKVDILVELCPDSAHEDVMGLSPGSVVIYDEPLHLEPLRNDLIFYRVPFDKLVSGICPDSRLRRLVKNMVYDGVLAFLLGIEFAEMDSALQKQFRKKPKAADLNLEGTQAGFDYAQGHFTKADPYHIERMKETREKIIIDGNSATALGCMFAGVSVVAWYPITPASSLCESLIEYMNRFRKDKETGRATYAIVQAEDELAALGMAIAAGWAGARAMTSTSGPGLSLMAEFAGFAYYAEIPVVIIDVQRVGPSTGLPTRTAQSDLLFTRFLSHGDTAHILLFPGSVEECFSMAIEAFDLAETLQTPVFLMSDLDLGMNSWMADSFPYPEKPMQRGKVLTAADLDHLKLFERYRDVDGDGIPYRTLPGNPHPLAHYFCRGTAHDERARYSERPDDYVRNMDRLANKHQTARRRVPAPIVDFNPKADVGIIAFGSSHCAVVESRDQLRLLHGLETSYLRVRALPFNHELNQFVQRHQRVYVVEQNRDAQMLSLIRLESDPTDCAKLRSVRHYDGLPITPATIVRQITAQEGIGNREKGEG